jgi:RecB family exonuclease
LPEKLLRQWTEGREQVQRAVAVLQARLARQAAGLYEGDATALRERLQRHYPSGHVWSSSKLEAYATCPFLFFVRNGLGLEPRAEPEEGFDVLILGSIYHEILENVYRQAIAQDDWSETALLALLPTVSASSFADAPRRYGFRPTAIWTYQQEELTQVLAQSLAELAHIAGDFRPYALEQAFGLDEKPPLQVQTDTGSFRLRGYIDRIDQDPAGRLRIIDYKSGSKPIRPQDLDEGKRIQLPLYAQAASEALALGAVVEGFYWHIGSAKASQLKLAAYPNGVPGAQETAVEHALRTIHSIRSGRFQPHPPAGGCPGSCPAIEFCWRYRRGWS